MAADLQVVALEELMTHSPTPERDVLLCQQKRAVNGRTGEDKKVFGQATAIALSASSLHNVMVICAQQSFTFGQNLSATPARSASDLQHSSSKKKKKKNRKQKQSNENEPKEKGKE